MMRSDKHVVKQLGQYLQTKKMKPLEKSFRSDTARLSGLWVCKKDANKLLVSEDTPL